MIQKSWEKHGIIFQPDSSCYWMNSHAQLPTLLKKPNDVVRVYFAGRDEENKSHVGFFDFDLEKLSVIDFSKSPLLLPGSIGCFDADGVYPSSIIEIDSKIYMYYIGWTKGAVQPLFYASIGLAISSDGGNTFEKYSTAPIMSRSQYDPCLVTAPSVKTSENGDYKFEMIYTSGIKWDYEENGDLRSHYHLKKAYSNDGISWKRFGEVVIELEEGERDISRSTQIKYENKDILLFGVNTVSEPYSIKIAELVNGGENWCRTKTDFPKISKSVNEFDSHLMSYPSLINHKGNIYMFYNGNNFGKEGVALAILKNG